jgi:predicted nucleic acid-binding Zn ribbon protein
MVDVTVIKLAVGPAVRRESHFQRRCKLLARDVVKVGFGDRTSALSVVMSAKTRRLTNPAILQIAQNSSRGHASGVATL